MICGYALAVITGFLLTVVSNWTGVQALHGLPLLLLAGAVGRVLLPLLDQQHYLRPAGLRAM